MTEDTTEPRQRCGVIGMGIIGAGIAGCLVRNGREVSGYDIRPEAVTGVSGVKICSSPAEVAFNSDVIIISVVNADQARAVLFGPQGIAEGVHPNLVVALMSTIRVPIVLELSEEAKQKGFKLIDVTITTGGAPTSEGTAGLMAGGDNATIESVRGVMEEFSSIFSHMGPIGTGIAAKVARNIMHYCAIMGAYEGGLLAEAAGVDINKLIEVIRKSDPHNIQSTIILEKRGVAPLDEKTFPKEIIELFYNTAKLLHKDLDAGIDLANTLNVDVPGAMLAMQRGDLIHGLPPGTTKHIPAKARDSDPKRRGSQMMDETYGKGTVKMPPASDDLPPFVDATFRIVFGDIWTRPQLSIRDRRLLVIGAIAQMNRPDLIEVQVLGALANNELTEEQLQEAVLHLAFYCGWPNGTTVYQGVTSALKKFSESKQKPKSYK
ncbi:MAG: hydroxyacid dehydrogenase [Desulfobacterium sp.]|nr:hydroxyacid dehydrogenase [Desulfobacterium sp.]MBU3947886.1 carboxymuconolactone decarboxylase family protein [Pseudomonadota bacterium]MBU4010436.1 carboxymuconolactone decarboxylase family protein [Pseudomonadota bacterium]MBU4035511.1 carboxymuconolactone decarboxylase family protein [Pseudomonadota bacterium]